jgi:hypothetical protein
MYCTIIWGSRAGQIIRCPVKKGLSVDPLIHRLTVCYALQSTDNLQRLFQADQLTTLTGVKF